MIRMRLKHKRPEDLLRQSGLRCTKPRIQVLRTLSRSSIPLSARELSEMLHRLYPETAGWLSTVYRTLDLLYDRDLLMRFDFPHSHEAAYLLKSYAGDQYFAICLHCHKLIPLGFETATASIRQDLHSKHFLPTSHRLEVYGYCEDCSHHHLKQLN